MSYALLILRCLQHGLTIMKHLKINKPLTTPPPNKGTT